MRVEEEEYEEDGIDYEIDYDYIVSGMRYGVRLGEAKNQEDNNLGSIKIRIPSFQGNNDPKAYLEYGRKVEMVVYCHNYSENKKVKLVVIEFSVFSIVCGTNYC